MATVTSTVPVVSPAKAAVILELCAKAREAVLLVGKPGVGKSDIIRAAAKNLGYNLIVLHPAIMEPTDLSGVPANNGDGTAVMLPYANLKRIVQSVEPTIVALEDFGQAMPAVQNAAMQILHAATGERRIGDLVIPDNVTFVLTSNRRSDRANVQGITETIKSRIATIIEVETSLDDWTQWAYTADIAPEIIAFLRTCPKLLHEFVPTADFTNSPSPRTWAHASKLFGLGFGIDTRLQVLSGAVGEGAAAQFLSFLNIFEKAPSIDSILRDPENADIPSNEPSALYAVASGLAYHATPKNFGSIVIYAQRLFKAKHAEFAALIVKDSVRKNKAIAKTESYTKYCLSAAGKHLAEVHTDVQ
jgi:hypothetical protein